jgi:phosphohistidine phosphatase
MTMKILYLLRHAKSKWDDSGKSDFERPLNKRGIKGAEIMGGVFAERGIKPDGMLSSSSARTRETLAIIAPMVGFPFDDVRFTDELYLAPADRILSMVRSLDDSLEEVLICGHNPGMEETARHYLGRQAGNFPTCGFLEIKFSGDAWKKTGPKAVKSHVFLYPRMFCGGED